MAAKQCPGCRKQVPVACKRCGCGHTFFAARRPAGSKGKREDGQKKEKLSLVKNSPVAGVVKPPSVPNYEEEDDIPLSTLRHLKQEEADLPRRRTGRVQREKPNFYDALEYDNQMRRKRVVKGKPKQGDEGPSTSKSIPMSVEIPQKEPKSETRPVLAVVSSTKKRRGRPPRLTNSKGVKSSKTAAISLPLNNQPKQPKEPTPSSFVDSHEDIMKGITPEKALQCATILDDINRKWATISWRI